MALMPLITHPLLSSSSMGQRCTLNEEGAHKKLMSTSFSVKERCWHRYYGLHTHIHIYMNVLYTKEEGEGRFINQ